MFKSFQVDHGGNCIANLRREAGNMKPEIETNTLKKLIQLLTSGKFVALHTEKPSDPYVKGNWPADLSKMREI